MNQRYTFTSAWQIPAHPKIVWATMTTTPFTWDAWWPQLGNLHIVKQTPALIGTTFRCSWRAPLGYRLDCVITITDVSGRARVRLHIEGDLHGDVTCILRETSTGTTIDVDWEVQTTRPWMNRFAPLLRPLFIWGHHVVMHSGERGLRRYIGTQGI